jgi:sialidase-1
MMNSRSPRRTVAISRDCGETRSPMRAEPALQTTPTAAGFIRYSGLGDGDKSRLLFTNPSARSRVRGMVSLSYDNGQTWSVQKLLRPGRFGYSCLARLPDDSVGCVFEGAAEKGEFPEYDGRGVLLARFTMDWLTEGKDRIR